LKQGLLISREKTEKQDYRRSMTHQNGFRDQPRGSQLID